MLPSSEKNQLVTAAEVQINNPLRMIMTQLQLNTRAWFNQNKRIHSVVEKIAH